MPVEEAVHIVEAGGDERVSQLEDPGALVRVLRAIAAADTLLIGGSSLAVYPAASLTRYFRGRSLVILNLSPTPQDGAADLLVAEPIGDALGGAVDALFAEG